MGPALTSSLSKAEYSFRTLWGRRCKDKTGEERPWLGRESHPRHPLEGQRPGLGTVSSWAPTSQVWARRLMAELLRPNMTAKKELRFFCSLRL